MKKLILIIILFVPMFVFGQRTFSEFPEEATPDSTDIIISYDGTRNEKVQLKNVLTNDVVKKENINADVAGDGLTQDANGSLKINVDGSSVYVTNDTLYANAPVLASGDFTDLNPYEFSGDLIPLVGYDGYIFLDIGDTITQTYYVTDTIAFYRATTLGGAIDTVLYYVGNDSNLYLKNYVRIPDELYVRDTSIYNMIKTHAGGNVVSSVPQNLSTQVDGGIFYESGDSLATNSAFLFTGGTKTAGAFYTGTTNPTSTNRLNFDGTLWVGDLRSSTASRNIYLSTTSTTSYSGEITGGFDISSGLGLTKNAIHLDNYINGSGTRTGSILKIENIVDGSINNSGHIIEIVDNPTSSGTQTGKTLSATIGSTERISFNPRLSASSGGTAYFIDSHENLQSGDTIFAVYNYGVRKFAVDYNGNVFVSNDLTVNGDSINATSTKLKSKLFIGELYVDGDSTLAISAGGTYYTFKKWNTTGVNINVTATDSTLTVVSGGSGYYDIKYHGSVGGISNAVSHASLFINDVEVSKMETEETLPATAGNRRTLSSSCKTWLNDGDVLKIKYRTDTSTGTFTITHSNFNIERSN